MNMKKCVLLGISFLATLPLLSNAQTITVKNNTDFYGTAKLAGHCSNEAGSRGIMHPHASLSIPLIAIKELCGNNNCTANVYMTQNCSGTKIGDAVLNAKNGVVSITNDDEKQFHVTGGGFNVTIDPATDSATGGFFD